MEIKFNKRIISFVVLILTFFVGALAFAKTNSDIGEYNIEVSNPEIAKHFMEAEKTNDTVVKINEYMLASNAIKKLPLTKDNAVLIAYVNYQIGKNAMGIVKFDVAARAFWKSYTVLKFKGIHRNNKLAFLDLLHLITLAEVSNNEKFERYYMEELVKTQKSFLNSNPCEFKKAYDTLSNYYINDKNYRKANFYKAKALNLCKQPAQQSENKNQLIYACPDSGKFIELGKTIYNHGNVHLAKLKDGRILIADFDILPTDMNKKLDEKDYYLKKFEIYNPKTRKFEHMAQPIYWHSNSQPIVLDDGRVLIVGASCPMQWKKQYVTQFQIDTCEQSQYAELYDPTKNEFKLAGKMVIPRGGFGIAKLQDGRVLITNGHHGLPRTYLSNGEYDNSLEFKIPRIEATAEIFDPKTETFSLTGASSINIVREATNPKKEKCLISTSNGDEQAITLDNGEVLVLWTTQGVAEIYNPATGEFRRISDMTRVINSGFPPPSVKKLKDGRVIIISGHSPKTWNTAEIFDPKTEIFTGLGKMAANHGTGGISNSTVLKNGQVLIFGGSKGSDSYPPREIILKSMELFDPQTNKFNYIGEKKSKDVSGKSILLNDGNVFFISNCSKYKYKNTCGELYIPNYK